MVFVRNNVPKSNVSFRCQQKKATTGHIQSNLMISRFVCYVNVQLEMKFYASLLHSIPQPYQTSTVWWSKTFTIDDSHLMYDVAYTRPTTQSFTTFR